MWCLLRHIFHSAKMKMDIIFTRWPKGKRQAVFRWNSRKKFNLAEKQKWRTPLNSELVSQGRVRGLKKQPFKIRTEKELKQTYWKKISLATLLTNMFPIASFNKVLMSKMLLAFLASSSENKVVGWIWHWQLSMWLMEKKSKHTSVLYFESVKNNRSREFQFKCFLYM